MAVDFEIKKDLEKRSLVGIDRLNESIEKDAHDSSQKINDLRTKIIKARDYVEKMPGIQFSKEGQLKQIDVLRKQLVTKNELIQKYKALGSFDLS